MAHLAAALHVELSLTLNLYYLIWFIASGLNWGLTEDGKKVNISEKRYFSFLGLL
jgi:hypothetical protein